MSVPDPSNIAANIPTNLTLKKMFFARILFSPIFFHAALSACIGGD
ncbi:MAG: hypothetical protein ABJQ67_12915 [Marinobacter sp.]